VLLPDGRDGEGTVAGFNCGDGHPRTLRAGPGGRYRVEHLTPGNWQVVERDEELRAGSRTIQVTDEASEIR
jgi:hypothetical protein